MTTHRRPRPQRPLLGRRGSAPRGFTLMEVLLVLAILGVIGALVVPNLLGSQQAANIKAAKQGIVRLEGVLETYAIDHAGQLPKTLDALTQASQKEGIDIPPQLDKIPKDPWGNAYNYTFPATHQKLKTKADIWSNGPNGTNDNGSGDDVNNWSDLESK